MVNILQRNLSYRWILALSKIQLRSDIQNIVLKDDNYLYLVPKTKLFTFRNFYAYHRLYYAVKNFLNRQSILKSFFRKWKLLIVDIIPKHLTNIFRKYATVRNFTNFTI